LLLLFRSVVYWVRIWLIIGKKQGVSKANLSWEKGGFASRARFHDKKWAMQFSAIWRVADE
jgi:hypothetical protein